MNAQDHPAESGRTTGSDPEPGPDGAEPGCDDAVAQLYSYLDGELDGATVVRVEAHLKRCSPCLEAFDFHAELRQVIRSKCAQSMPDDVRAKLLGMLKDPSA